MGFPMMLYFLLKVERLTAIMVDKITNNNILKETTTENDGKLGTDLGLTYK
jgi:hypothetical protein